MITYDNLSLFLRLFLCLSLSLSYTHTHTHTHAPKPFLSTVFTLLFFLLRKWCSFLTRVFCTLERKKIKVKTGSRMAVSPGLLSGQVHWHSQEPSRSAVHIILFILPSTIVSCTLHTLISCVYHSLHVQSVVRSFTARGFASSDPTRV